MTWIDYDDGHAGGYPHECAPNLKDYTRTIWAVQWVEAREWPRHSEFDNTGRDNEGEAREFLNALVIRGNHTGVLVRAEVSWQRVD